MQEYEDTSDKELREAIALSLNTPNESNFVGQNTAQTDINNGNRISAEEIRRNRQAFIDKLSCTPRTTE
ncbi:unnamed protein product [Schistosoma curassoni]|uniref:Uncharacterized protein n=1 Tax=Schistosoma curassoni TaxID=6186 RepID=A0A3P8FXG3_9TREM|nr:unnamed protein product [Schistosoma curassoni]